MAPEKLQLPLPFEQIMQRHEREIMRYLLRVSGNGADAADLFQETWLRAYRAYPRLEPESEVRPWLYAIAVNLCRNRTRDGARRARVIVADEKKNPNDRNNIKLAVKHDEGDNGAHTGRRQGGENGDRVHQALVEHAEHDVDGEQGGDDEQRLGGQGLLESLGSTGEGAAHRCRNTDPPLHLIDQLGRFAQ